MVDHPAMQLWRRLAWIGVVGVFVTVTACKGDTGEPGPEGPPGPPGEPGESPDDGIELEPFGLVGRVSEPNSVLVPGGAVYLVPATDVDALSETSVDLFATPEETASLDNDEPIEDLIDANGDSYEMAAVNSEGIYRFETLPEGSHFVVWVPADGDDLHLPGGDNSRTAFDSASLVGMRMDMRVSSQPSASATYVGSTTCMGCHGYQSTTRTAHGVGLQVPGVRSILQDIEPWPDFDIALDTYFEFGATLYFYDCSRASPSTHDDPSGCSVSDQDPGPAADVSFQIDLRRNSNVPLGVIGAYEVEMLRGGATPQTYEVVLTYGGALSKQQYLMRRPNADGTFSYFVLPIQFNYQGDDANENPEDWRWRDYRSDLWFDFANPTAPDAFIQPESAESFDNNCAGCHFTGYDLRGNDADGWSARAVVDAGGSFDYDGDGRPELINTGCEACHGPGSEHLELSPRGGFIVSPGLLTPGRHVAICGSCHSRPVGVGAGMTGLPLSMDDRMPSPGIRRGEFAVEHTTRVSGAQEAFFTSGDPAAHYQQYSDHIRSRHHRNPERILTCSGCHNPHAGFGDVYGAEVEDNLNVVCTVCHSNVIPVIEHVQATTGFAHSTIPREFRCTECHMVPTAESGAATPALLDAIPSGAPLVQYYWNDTASHRMVVVGREAFDEQPTAATNQCAVCHGGFFPNE
jgi:hypothetical protein